LKYSYFGEKIFAFQYPLNNCTSSAYGTLIPLVGYNVKKNINTRKKKRAEARRKGGLKTPAHNPLQ
jgi:hypothetical protein